MDSLLFAAALFGGGLLALVAVGPRASRYADIIARQTGLSRGLAGMVLLAVTTSLPEVVASATAALNGSPDLAIGNVFGSNAFNIMILAIVDIVGGPRPLVVEVGAREFFTGVSVVFLTTLAVFLLTLGSLGFVLGVGLNSVIIAVAYLVLLRLTESYRERQVWTPHSERVRARSAQVGGLRSDAGRQEKEQHRESAGLSLKAALVRFSVVAAIIVAAGIALATAAEAIARLTGLGATFVGSIFLAAATSSPEVVVSAAAARQGNLHMAVATIFGSNLFNLTIIFVADVFFMGGPITSAIAPQHVTTALLAILLASVALGGLIYRSTHAVLRLGVESAIILLLYLAGAYVLYLQAATPTS